MFMSWFIYLCFAYHFSFYSVRAKVLGLRDEFQNLNAFQGELDKDMSQFLVFMAVGVGHFS